MITERTNLESTLSNPQDVRVLTEEERKAWEKRLRRRQYDESTSREKRTVVIGGRDKDKQR